MMRGVEELENEPEEQRHSRPSLLDLAMKYQRNLVGLPPECDLLREHITNKLENFILV